MDVKTLRRKVRILKKNGWKMVIKNRESTSLGGGKDRSS